MIGTHEMGPYRTASVLVEWSDIATDGPEAGPCATVRGVTDLPTPRPLRAVIGEAVRRLREAADVRQEEIARIARVHGLTWSRSKVAALERGDKPVSLEEFVLLPRILAEATGSMVASGMLIEDGAVIRLTDRISAPGETLKSVLGGQWVRPEASMVPFVMELPEMVMAPSASTPTFDDTDRRVGARLGEHPATVASLAHHLWGRSLSTERDQRTKEREPDASPDRRRALRGQVTRQLIDELAAELGHRGESAPPAGGDGSESAG